ncbi:LPD11 domain-containing protein [Anaerovorax sp. IOR16]|uniref:LPD11 domain-containing protein n=1 Tax=Anaerovorax sp. IOR16 TaxID=2773458 RepID=UPI001AD932D9|nr:LPD11 domain-containing protein [Anaerovorax sp. IOR16]
MKLEYIGKDDWGKHTYKDENGRYWKDETPHQEACLSLYSVIPNTYDGELAYPISQIYKDKDIEIEFINGRVIDSPYQFEYMLLGRLQMDCDYYLGNGNRYANHLWAKNEIEQIQKMKELWNGFPDNEKPEWLTYEQILEYERKMITDII